HDGRRGICYGARVALVRRRKLREPELLTSSAGFRSAIVIAATLFFWATLPHPALAQTVSFVARRDFAAGTNPASVAVDDFNGDGVLDLAVAAGPESVSVLLGKGDGTFEAPRSFDAGGTHGRVAVGDFNGDGVRDLVVAGSGTVSVLLGKGDGTFQAAVRSPAGNYLYSVTVGDFNGDGVQDLAVANFDSASVSVLLGNGDGTFRAETNFSLGSGCCNGPLSVTVGDLSGDGEPDLAVAIPSSNHVLVLQGTGNGTFQAALAFGAGSRPASMAVGDFNGDGKPDLAVSNTMCWSCSLSVLINNTPVP